MTRLVGVLPLQHASGLVADQNQFDVDVSGGGGQLSADVLDDAAVDGATQASVGCESDDQVVGL